MTDLPDTALNPALDPVRLEDFEALAARSETVISRLRDRVYEADGRLPEPRKDPITNRRQGYSLAEVNAMRAAVGSLPHRADTERALVMAVQSFKGGVGKSTVTCHLAQYFALKGYRVCIVDCDSQASTTSIFGLNPEVDVDEDDDTLYPYFRHGGPVRLHLDGSAARAWDAVALCPARRGCAFDPCPA